MELQHLIFYIKKYLKDLTNDKSYILNIGPCYLDELSEIDDIRLNSYSDKRIKTEIEPIKNGLDVINRLEPCSYNINTVYNGKSILNNKECKTIKQNGFIAQDIDKIPQLKHSVVQPNNPDELYRLNYQNIFVYQTSAIKELHKIIVNQQNVIEDLNIRMKNLEKAKKF